MDSYEATKVVFSRIQSLDSENASKIMGLILIQDHGEKEMIRLAFGPETLLHSVVLKARQELGISTNPNPRFTLKIPTSLTLSSLASPSSASSSLSPSWGPSVFPDFQNPDENLMSPGSNGVHLGSSNSSKLNPATPPFYCGGGGGGGELMDGPHRRSYSVSDINLVDDPAFGLGWKPCLYYARGFCKNGSSCRFIHGGGDPTDVAAANMVEEQCHELLRSKSMQHQKLMTAMASTSPTFPYSMNKGLSLFSQHQQNDSPRSVAAMMMNEELNKFSRARLENGRGVDSNPVSRQIYLTFPADSTFREEDVSNYFSIYGPVQDVRIPYQQKRMFGFVTFVYPETVKIILAKGNPHFVCDARVLVKPYKEKGKVPDKFRKQQQMERGEFSGCNSPTALDSRDPFDLQLGSRMMYDTQYMLWKRKLEEQADLEQALELQTRRLMGLQLLDIKRNHHNHHHRSLSTGAPIPSPTQSPNSIFHQNLLGSDRSSPDAPDDNCRSPPLHEATDRDKEDSFCEDNTNNCSVKEGPFPQDNNLPESLELNLPDSPFASQTRGAREYMTAFSGGMESDNIGIPIPGANMTSNNTKGSSFHPASSSLDMPPFNSCYFQMPRFSPGHGAVGM